LFKIGCHGSALEESKKAVQIRQFHQKTLSYGEKIVKIGLVDSEIFGLGLKKKKLKN